MSGSASAARAWKEQTAFERAQWDYKASGIILLALEEPDMPRVLIADRFGLTVNQVQHLLNDAGVPREYDGYSDHVNGRRAA